MELTEAYRECERITWTQARNFAYGIRLLPAGKRRGLAVIYAFARRIDDIGDGTMPAQEKIAALEEARRAVLDLTLYRQGDPASLNDPVLIALADVERNFPVQMAAFGELIDGCVADVRGTSYQTFEDLLHYCRCVAGSIGRLSLGIFGTSGDHEVASRLSDSLGVALQLTNILRDVREDYASGRVYLPAEDLAKFDCDVACLGGDDPPRPPPLFLPGGPIPPDPPRERPIPPGPPWGGQVPPARSSRGWSSSRPNGPGTGTPPACDCCRCLTAAARPAPVPWPASTGGCSIRSRPSPRRYCAAGCRCRRGRRPWSR